MLTEERDELASVLQLMDGLADQWGDEAVFRRCRDRIRSLLTPPEPLVWAVSPIQLAGAIVHVANDLPSTFDLLEYRDRVACCIRNKRDGSFSLKVEFDSLESAKQACEALRPFLEQIGGGE